MVLDSLSAINAVLVPRSAADFDAASAASGGSRVETFDAVTPTTECAVTIATDRGADTLRDAFERIQKEVARRYRTEDSAPAELGTLYLAVALSEFDRAMQSGRSWRNEPHRAPVRTAAQLADLIAHHWVPERPMRLAAQLHARLAEIEHDIESSVLGDANALAPSNHGALLSMVLNRVGGRPSVASSVFAARGVRNSPPSTVPPIHGERRRTTAP